MKHFFFLLFCIFPSILVSCASSNPVYTAVTGNGSQVFFLRPFVLDTAHSMINQIDLDITVNVRGSILSQSPVLNYTVTMPIEQVKEADKIQIHLTNQSTEVRTENRTLLFKDINGKKYIDLRYSVTLNKDDFFQLMKNEESCFIKVVAPDGTIDLIQSDDFDLRMRNLRLMVL